MYGAVFVTAVAAAGVAAELDKIREARLKELKEKTMQKREQLSLGHGEYRYGGVVLRVAGVGEFILKSTAVVVAGSAVLPPPCLPIAFSAAVLYSEINEEEFLKEVTSSELVVCHFFHKDFERCKIMDMVRVSAPHHSHS